jgi:hypothetical protein
VTAVMRAALVAEISILAAGCVEPVGPERLELDSPCGAAITQVPIEYSPHLAPGTPIEWTTNPPASGPHYPVWARWEHHYPDLPRAYWLHNAEHGGIVLAYRRPDAASVAAELIATVAALPDDPHCAAPIRTRTLVVADPALPEDVEVAAVAWGTTYTAACVDDTLATFAREHTGRAGENTCADGLDLGGAPLD